MSPKTASTSQSDARKTKKELLAELLELRARAAIPGDDGVKSRGIAEALRENEEQFRIQADDVPTLVWATGPDGAELVNRAYLEFLGVGGQADVQGFDWARYVHPDDREGYLNAYMDCFRRQAPFEAVFRFRRHDGEYRWMKSTGRPRYTPAGEFSGFVGSTQDITEQKAMEDELRKAGDSLEKTVEQRTVDLRESEEKYRRIVVMANEGIWVLDRDNVTTFVNPKMAGMLGYSPEEMVGRKPDGFIDNGYREEVRNRLNNRRRGTNEQYTCKYLRKDGGGLWAIVSGTPIYDGNGEYTGAMAMITDITERKQAEEGKERLGALMDHNPSMVFMKDVSGRYVYLNNSYEKQFVHAKDWFGKTDFDFWPRESAELFRANDAEVLGSGRTHRFIEDSTDLQGKRHCWLNYKFPFTDSNGNKYVGGIGIDIIDRIIAEEALKDRERQLAESQVLSNTGSWELNLTTNEVTFSDNLLRIIGLPQGEHTYDEFQTLVHPDDKGRRNEALKDAIENGKPYDIEYRIIRPDNDVRYVHVVGILSHDPLEKPKKFTAVVQDTTERKRAEEALRDSEERYRSLFESSRDAIGITDMAGNILKANTAFQQMLGYSAEEMRHLNYVQLTPGPWRERDEHIVQEQIIPRGFSDEYEKEYIRKDGTTFPISIRVWLLKDKNGANQGLWAIIRDITERKRAEEALEESKIKLERVFSSMSDAVSILDKDGNFVDCNEAFVRLFGYRSKDECLTSLREEEGRIYLKKLDGRPLTYDEWPVLRALNGETVTDFENIFGLKNAEGELILSNNFSPLYDGTGQIAGVVCVFHDITERKRAEEALRESEEKFRALAETSSSAIFVYQNERFVYVNPSAEQTTGYNKEELLEMKFWDLLHPDDRDMGRERGKARQRGETVPPRYEAKYRTKDGRDRILEINATTMYYNGRLAGLATALDITERKRAEEELKATKTQAELYLDLMGHDINNFNQATMGFLELARDAAVGEGGLDAGGVELLDKAIGSLSNSSQLIANVRKLQRERMGLYKPEVMDLGETLKDVCGRFRNVPNRYVKVNCGVVMGMKVLANELLKDVFINLVGNAIKHSYGPLIVNIWMNTAKVDGVKYYEVLVEDNGPGIPDGLKKTLFGNLDSTAIRARGKGFGLYLIKTLVDDFHGKFRVEDRIEGDHTKGARFVVMLPAIVK